MIGAISSSNFIKDIEQVANTLGENFALKSVGLNLDIAAELEKIGTIKIKHLFIDISSINKAELVQSLMKYKILNENTQIIIIAPGSKPGDELIYKLVTLVQVYDIIVPDEYTEEYTEEEYTVFSHLIFSINNPATYKRAVKWLNFDDNITSNKEKSKVKVVEKEVEKTVTVYKPMPLHKRVGIFSLSERAGSSFLTVNLAMALSFNKIDVSVVEFPYQKPYLYDYISLENYLQDNNSKFLSIPHLIADSSSEVKKSDFTVYKDISWIVVDPKLNNTVSEKWSFEKSIRLLDLCRESIVTLVDVGYISDENTIKDIISIIDIVFIVIDSNPADIMCNIHKLAFFKSLSYKSVYFVLNKWNSGVDKKELLNYLDINPLAFIPFVDPTLIYKCAYSATIPFESKDVQAILNDSFSILLKNIVPSELISEKLFDKKLKFKSLFRR